MKEIILDCKEMSSKEKAHEYIMKKMSFPDYYGKNLDALYDILSTYDKEVYVKFINFESLFKQLGDYAVSLIDVFRESEEENTKIKFSML
ncbi:MAG: barstar family protein [Clostridium sp.]|nr:barstar family protein [Clostridium sp.]